MRPAPALVLGGALAFICVPVAIAAGVTARLSVTDTGAQGNGGSFSPSISADGRYVAYSSASSNLIPGDTNTCFAYPQRGSCPDVFVGDLHTRTTTRVSVSVSGEEANDFSDQPALSADGRYVAFSSWASNLVTGDTNMCDLFVAGPFASCGDIFVHDRETGDVVRVSVASDDRQANDFSEQPVLSADGRYVAFASNASNLVPGDTNGVEDVFVHDRDADEDGIFDEPGQIATTRVSLSSAGGQADSWSVYPDLSADGRYVVFQSDATNLVPGDTNFVYDIFVHDRVTARTRRVSVSPEGTQGNDYSLGPPTISGDGRYVALRSAATNLVPEPDLNGYYYDVFVHDRDTDEDGIFDEPGAIDNIRVNESSDGTQANSFAFLSVISDSGRAVMFWSEATNLVPGDTNGAADIFLHDRITARTIRLSVASDGTQANDDSFYYGAGLSADGSRAVFYSLASNLVPGDSNGATDVFIRARRRPNQ